MNFNVNITESFSESDIKSLINKCDEYDILYDCHEGDYLIQLGAYTDTGLMLGFISCYIPLDDTTESVDFDCVVHPEYRRCGIFKMLFSKMKDILTIDYDFKGKYVTSMRDDLYEKLSHSSLHITLSYKEHLMSLTHPEKVLSMAKCYDNSPYILCPNICQNDYDKNCQDIYQNTCQDTCQDASFYELYRNIGRYSEADEDKNSPLASLYFSSFDSTICIHQVFVEPEERKKGLGTQLVCLALNNLIDTYGSDKNIILQVSSTNLPACHVYEKCGFTVQESVSFYYVN
ncbi:MAG: GNAT family N-acetyltransferase [Eubacteriales bacterium]|nr:GNAT family N-acetyltransferase [Eubacteriales bacterium]